MRNTFVYLLLVFIASVVSCYSNDGEDESLAQSQIMRFESVDFKGLYVGETRTKVVKIFNTTEDDITITKVFLGNFDEGTESDEFKIVKMSEFKALRLRPEHCLQVEIEFRPQKLGDKLANLIVYTRELQDDMIYSLKGLCCDELEFVTPEKLPSVRYLEEYEVTFESKGGDGKYTFEVDRANKFFHDKSVWLDFKDNKIFGTAYETGEYEFDLYVHDGSGHTVKRTFTLLIENIYADLKRSRDDKDTQFAFRKGDEIGQFIVNLEHEGNIPLRINSIELSGSGYDSGETKIVKMPNLPHVVEVKGKVQVIIDVKSNLLHWQDVKLHVKHDGARKEFAVELHWDIYRENKYTFILNRSESMSEFYRPEIQTVMDGNGNVAPYPSKWQQVQTLTSSFIMALREYEQYDIISFTSKVYHAFRQFKTADNGNKGAGIGWIFNQNPAKQIVSHSVDISDSDINITPEFALFEALKSAFNDYDIPETIILMTDGVIELKFDWNFRMFFKQAGFTVKLLSKTKKWIAERERDYKEFEFKIVCVDKDASTFLKLLERLPNTTLKCSN